jgi:hypothetical protein
MHWSTDETDLSEPAEPVAPVPAPPPLAPVERVVEILERFYLEDARLTAELLQELSLCSAADLVKLFSPAVRAPSPAYAPAPADEALADQPPTDDTPAAELPAEPGAQKPNDPHAGWRWDSTGRRTAPRLPSAFGFTKGYERPPSRSTHWSG